MSRVSGKPYYLYILWSAVGCRFYVGITEDTETRLLQHNQGLSTWTAKFIPWEMVHREIHPDYTAARKRELLLKKQKGGNGFFRLTGLDPVVFRGENRSLDL